MNRHLKSNPMAALDAGIGGSFVLIPQQWHNTDLLRARLVSIHEDRLDRHANKGRQAGQPPGRVEH